MIYFIELRNRLYLLITCWISVFVIGYLYKEVFLFEILSSSLNDNSGTLNDFIFTYVSELFTVYLDLAYFVSKQISIMYLCYHVVFFLAPGLYLKEYHHFITLFKLIFLFWIFSLGFLKFFLIPFLWDFFSSFQTNLQDYSLSIRFEAKVSEYLDFFMKICFTCNLQFQVIVLAIFFINFFLTNKSQIKSFRNIFYFIFLLLGTIMTPPDVFSQLLFFSVLILFFEIIIFYVLFFEKIKKFNSEAN